MKSLFGKMNYKVTYRFASVLALAAVYIVSTASIVFIYSADTPEELLK